MKSTLFSTVLTAVLFSGALVVGGCSSSEDDSDEIKDNDPISSHFGEFVNIPNFNEADGIATQLVATDDGLYVTVGSTDDVDDWIYRYDLDQENILNGTWQKTQYPASTSVDFLEDKTPLNWKSEIVSEHEIFTTPQFVNFETPVFYTLNMASGSIVKQENAPIHKFEYVGGGTYDEYGRIVKDDSGQDWAVFQGATVSDNNLHVIKLRYGNLPFNSVCSFTAEGGLYFSTSPSSSNLYALSLTENKLFIIKTNGDILTKDLSPYYNSELSLFGFKNKFRFSNTGTYFQFQDKVLKLVNDENLTLFYTIKYSPGDFDLGDFCVDNDYLFATDGTRKELGGFNKEVNIIPGTPSTYNQEILMDYITKTNHFKLGELETSTNPKDKYIYVLGQNGKILVISKNYL